MLRISQNGELSIVGQGRGNGCHAVSANGSRMIMESSESTEMNSGYGVSYKLGADGSIDAMPKNDGDCCPVDNGVVACIAGFCSTLHVL